MVTTKTLKRLASGEPVSESEIKESTSNYKYLSVGWDEIKTREELLRKLANFTEGYVGADIEAVCREAAILALREDIQAKEVLPRHFEKALDKVRPSVTKDVEKLQAWMREPAKTA